MLLLVDVGNSNIVFGLAENNNIKKTFRLRTNTNQTVDEYYMLLIRLLNDYKIDDIIISSVVPIVTSVLINLFKKYYNISSTVIGPGVKTGISVRADDPRSVGADLICDVVGAKRIFDECLIIDLGTATKYLYMKDNFLYGVSIGPGVSVSMKAMISSAALLPNIELQTPKKILNNNTVNCMQSGVIYGFASQVDGMIDRIGEEVGNKNLNVVATGGLSKLIIPLCKHRIDLNENLVLEGMLDIYIRNN